MRIHSLAFAIALASQIGAQAPQEQPAPNSTLGALLRDDTLGGIFRRTLAVREGLESASILQDYAASPAKRVWGKTKQEPDVWFRRTIDLAKPCKAARLVFSCDNECTVFVNGREVGACDNHQNLTVVDLKTLMKGKMTLAVRAKNTGGPGALVLWFLWEDADGKHEVTTDERWRISLAEADKWADQGFDDSSWNFATAEYATDFGKNTYNGTPIRVHVVNDLTPAVASIDQAIAALRAAQTREDALKALDELDRAAMRAREQVWKMPAAPEKAPK